MPIRKEIGNTTKTINTPSNDHYENALHTFLVKSSKKSNGLVLDEVGAGAAGDNDADEVCDSG